MKFDSIRRDSGLSVQEVKHADARHLDGNIRGLKTCRNIEFRVELIPRVRDSVQERAS